MISIIILLNNDMIKNYDKDIQMFFLQQMKHIIFLTRVRKTFI